MVSITNYKYLDHWSLELSAVRPVPVPVTGGVSLVLVYSDLGVTILEPAPKVFATLFSPCVLTLPTIALAFLVIPHLC